jgi:hypothetical protein
MRLRDWLGTLATIISAVLEHWLGETVTVAALTAAVVVFGGILWRRMSILMAAPRANNCTKAYTVDQRLTDYIGIMAPLSPIVTANTPTDTNSTLISTFTQMAAISSLGSTGAGGPGTSYSQTWANAVASALGGVFNTVNSILSELHSNKYMA